MAKINSTNEMSRINEALTAVQEMQYSAVGGRLRPDQAVGFILRSEKIRLRMTNNVMDLMRLAQQAEDGAIGWDDEETGKY
jgi:hypothetical protein